MTELEKTKSDRDKLLILFFGVCLCLPLCVLCFCISAALVDVSVLYSSVQVLVFTPLAGLMGDESTNTASKGPVSAEAIPSDKTKNANLAALLVDEEIKELQELIGYQTRKLQLLGRLRDSLADGSTRYTHTPTSLFCVWHRCAPPRQSSLRLVRFYSYPPFPTLPFVSFFYSGELSVQDLQALLLEKVTAVFVCVCVFHI
jgi:hypothetical protein